MLSFTVLSAIALAATAVNGQTQPDPSIATPVGVTQCEISSLTFFGTHPPFVISAIPGGQVGSTPLENIVTTSASPYPWLVNLQEGTYLSLQIRDSVGNLQYSSPITVLSSSNTTCLGSGTGGTTLSTGSGAGPTDSQTSTPAGGSSAPPATTSTPAGSSSPAGTSSGAPTTTSKPASSSAASSAASSPTTSKSGAAGGVTANVGLTGVFAFVVAALFA